MPEKVKLTNAAVSSQQFNSAIQFLSSKTFAYKLAWIIADLQAIAEEQVKRYEKARLSLLKSSGAKWNGRGYYFDALTGDPQKDIGKTIMPESLNGELTDLAEQEVEHELELVELPQKDKDGKNIDYEPLIFTALRKVLKRNI